MKVNKEYLKEFAKQNSLFVRKYINESGRHKIRYYFGVPLEKLKRITNLNQLEKRINEFGNSPSSFDRDLKIEAEETYNSLIAA